MIIVSNRREKDGLLLPRGRFKKKIMKKNTPKEKGVWGEGKKGFVVSRTFIKVLNYTPSNIRTPLLTFSRAQTMEEHEEEEEDGKVPEEKKDDNGVSST